MLYRQQITFFNIINYNLFWLACDQPYDIALCVDVDHSCCCVAKFSYHFLVNLSRLLLVIDVYIVLVALAIYHLLFLVIGGCLCDAFIMCANLLN